MQSCNVTTIELFPFLRCLSSSFVYSIPPLSPRATQADDSHQFKMKMVGCLTRRLHRKTRMQSLRTSLALSMECELLARVDPQIEHKKSLLGCPAPLLFLRSRCFLNSIRINWRINTTRHDTHARTHTQRWKANVAAAVTLIPPILPLPRSLLTPLAFAPLLLSSAPISGSFRAC